MSFKKFRVWLANAISGGEIDRLKRELEAEAAKLNYLKASHSDMLEKRGARTKRYSDALCDIIEMVTPASNGTVRKMARRAEEAIKG